MALRCVLEKVGRIGYNNHLKTKIGFLSAISIKNHQNLGPHSSSRWYTQPSHTSFSDDFTVHFPTEDWSVKDWSYHPQESDDDSEAFELEPVVDMNWLGGAVPFLGPLDDPGLTEAARIAVELHNKQQKSNLEFVRVVKAETQLVGVWYITFEATDAGVKNTYQAKVYCSFKKEWELQFFRLAPSNLAVKQGEQ